MAASGTLSFEQAADATLVIRVGGSWSLRSTHPPVSDVERQVVSASRISFDARELQGWDSSILTFLTKVTELCRQRGLAMDRSGLPPGIRRLLELAEAVPERKDALRQAKRPPLFERIGNTTLATGRGATAMLGFLGETTLTIGKFSRRKARYRGFDLSLLIQQCGAEALPIVTLISFLVGVILAFVGAVQLKKFGGQIYIADLVAIGIMRDMGAMMTAIIMAGRTGAAFAAEIGTMKVTQEIDALRASGFSPMEFLVLPRVIGLTLMMPLLCLYSDLVGMLGGAAIGVGMLDLSWTVYFQQSANALTLTDVFGGVFKSAVYGLLVALSGCLRGLQCGDSASAVGDAATSAVVTGIVAVVTACGVFAVVFYILGI